VVLDVVGSNPTSRPIPFRLQRTVFGIARSFGYNRGGPMPSDITIPISVFELTLFYEKPEVKFLGDRSVAAQALFTALAPMNPGVDDMELITTGRLSEQGVALKIPSQKISFFFGPTYCKFTKDGAEWSEADQILNLLTLMSDALASSAELKFAKRLSVLSLHLQLTTVSFKEILRTLMVPGILGLEVEQTDTMAIVARWPKRSLTLDGSAALANGLFLRNEREFDSGISFKDMQAAIRKDQQQLFTLLDVQEAQ
jgi:hypothetical protein